MFDLKEIINGQPTREASVRRSRDKDEFRRGVMTANLYVAKQKQDEREQQLSLREALLGQQAAQLTALSQATEQQASQVGGLLGQVMGGGAPQGMEKEPMPEEMMQ